MKINRVIYLFIIIAILLVALGACENAYKLSFSQEEYTVISGIEFVPEVKIRPKDTEYELSTSNITIAKVKDKTTIITLREGVVDITVTSGKKSATSTLYIDNDIEYDSGTIKFADTATVSFVIANYKLANLKTESYGIPMSCIKGGYLNLPTEPYIKGYKVHHWYEDRECTKKFDASKEISASLTLFAYIEQRETSYIVNNGFIAGLTYDNLPHSVLDLPKTTENGTEIVGIADNAFYNDENITSVNIPNTYKTIGDSAFAGCKNLISVNFVGGGSELEVVGLNAFGVARDSLGKEINPLESFVTFNLPDTVYEVGAYAFYKCKNLSFDGIPSNLDTVKQYSFAYTKINNVDFTNISEILEGAFRYCNALDTVTNTHNVKHSYQYAFENTKLHIDANNAYSKTPTKNDALAVFYADTIAFGVYSRYGDLFGSGDIILKDSCTLVADKAFFGINLKEITLYLNTDKANNAIESYDFLGYDLMDIGIGTKIVVPQDKVNAYKQRYSDYNDIFCYEDIKIFTSFDSVNFGVHRVLVFENENHAKSYYYHKYNGDAVIIDLNALGYAGATFVRISSFAFSNLAKVEEINLGKIERIATMAITSTVTNLKSIRLTSCVTPPILESASSFQIGGANFETCKIYVRSSEVNTYINAWKSYTTLANKVVGLI